MATYDQDQMSKEEECRLSDLFESHQQDFGLEDMRPCAFDPLEYFAPETQKAWEIFKAGARYRNPN